MIITVIIKENAHNVKVRKVSRVPLLLESLFAESEAVG